MKNEIINWLNRIEKKDGIPPAEVVAFNFGIGKSEEGYVMYFVGAFEYSEDDDDWACLEMPTKPYRYLTLPKRLQKKSWQTVLENSKQALLELEAEGAFKNNILKNAQAITTGFDDGDLVKIR